MELRIKFGVIGIQHDHIARMIKAVEDGGGQLALFYTSESNGMVEFGRLHPSATPARSEAEVLENHDISLIVSAIIPSERAQLGVRVMQAGKDYMADKGGILSLLDLETVRRVQAKTRRIYSISYNEHLLLPACVRAKELVEAGAIGRVVQMIGIGPHGLWGHGPRPDWFWTRAAREEFCAILEPTNALTSLFTRALSKRRFRQPIPQIKRAPTSTPNGKIRASYFCTAKPKPVKP